jgi:ATP-binding cassette subfamily B protein/ATP-binding cassette subfamily C protein
MMNEGTGPRLPLKRYWDLLAKYLEPLRFKVVLLAVLIFASIGLRLINPQIIRYFIDTAIATSDDQTLLTAALIFLGVALLLQGIGVAATYVGEDIGWRATNNLRADLALHCVRLDMSFHNEHTPGEMIERIDGDIADIAIFFAQFVIRILGNLLLIIGVFLVLLGEDWRISLALAIYTSIALAGLTYLRQIAVPLPWPALLICAKLPCPTGKRLEKLPPSYLAF